MKNIPVFLHHFAYFLELIEYINAGDTAKSTEFILLKTSVFFYDNEFLRCKPELVN